MALPAPALLSVEEYFRFEEPSKEKHEYYDGHLIAMAGASMVHSKIQSNLIIALGNGFKKIQKNCTPLSSDARAYVSDTRYFYPDVSVVCGDATMDEHNNLQKVEAIIEILSPSTESFDRNEKALAYKAMPGLQQLILVNSVQPEVIIANRIEPDSWQEKRIIDEKVSFQISGVDLSFDDIYDGIDF